MELEDISVPGLTDNVIDDNSKTRKVKLIVKDNDHNIDGDLRKIRMAAAESYTDAMQLMTRYGIDISTITLLCSLPAETNLDKLARYVELDHNGIVSIEYGDRSNKKTNRSLTPPKKKEPKKTFLNQATIRMAPPDATDRGFLNIKIFKNGSLQITGPKNMDEFYYIITKIKGILEKGGVRKTKSGEKKVRYIPKGTKLEITNPNIRLINSMFDLGFLLDRKKLDDILKIRHHYYTSDKIIGYVDHNYTSSEGHSGVHVEHHYNDNNTTHIFVFQTGSVIMTGAKNIYQILDAYHYITEIINHYRNEIEIVNIDIDELYLAIKEYRYLKKTRRNTLYG